MIDLFDLPYIENDNYYLFIDNVLGACSMITIMRKDRNPIVPNPKNMGPSTATYGLIDNMFDVKFSYHYDLPEFLKLEFDQAEILESYTDFRNAEIKRMDN